MHHKTLQERVQQRKERPTQHTNNKTGTVSKTQKPKNKTCENCDPMKLEWSYIKRHNNGRRGHREREGESTLTGIHSCHRRRIPFGHVLIERRCVHKHCKRRCNKEKKDQHTTNNKEEYRFKNTQTKITKSCEKLRSDETRVVVYSKYTTAEGVAMWP